MPNGHTFRNESAPKAYDRIDARTGTRSFHALLDSHTMYRSSHVYVILADIDNFGVINSEHGHEAGDTMLRKVGQAIADRFGQEHTYHYGSDEFVVVCPLESEESLLRELDELNGSLSALSLDSAALGLTCSFGYVYCQLQSSNDFHDALRLADRQMFLAKGQGKQCAAGVHMAEHARRHEDRARTYKSYESDALTGLANISHFHNQLSHVLRHHGIGVHRLTVVHFNVQNFKGYNEEFGFAAGDELLLLIARAIESTYTDCLVARSGSDQFLVATTESNAVPGIYQVRSVFRGHVKDSSVWLKAGVYICDDDTIDVGVICDRAKLACDTIKGRRDVFYRVYDEELKNQIATRHYILDHFDEALENGYIKVYYQPIVHVATGEVCDEEILARWEDPEHGLIYPLQFIPVLEEARLIHRLDLYVVRRSCENMQRRLRANVGDIPSLSINLSRIDFEQCDIVTEIENILAQYEVPHSYVSIEVTESALTGNQEFLRGEIDRFRADGFEVWMDDFGSGYSSLNLLKEYSFDLIKLDMGFLRNFEDNETSRILLANVISLVKELGIKTLVEGVETEAQLDFLKGVGCGKAQGYLFARPQSLKGVTTAIENGSYPPIEPMKERDFFGKLARINLMRPVPKASNNGHYVTSDVPAAILLKHAGTWSYLNTTEVYREYWTNIDGRSVEDNASLLNDPTSYTRARFEGALTAALVSGTWEGFTYIENDHTCTIRIKVIANDPQFDSTAILAIAS